MTAAERSECLSLYASGSTLQSLADRYDRHYGTIVALVRRAVAAGSIEKHGHKFRPRGKRQFKYYGRTSLDGEMKSGNIGKRT